MAGHLVITADDFGLAPEVNDAVEFAHRDGVLSAASLMVTGSAAGHAVTLARRMPTLRVGLHVVLVDGEPASPPEFIPDLVDSGGRLRGDMIALAFNFALRPKIRRQLEREIAAQFEAFRKTGLALDHVNAHKHFHLHPVIGGHIVALAQHYGCRALRVPSEPAWVVGGARWSPAQAVTAPWIALLRRRACSAGLPTPDAVFGLAWSGAMTAERLRTLLVRLPDGLVEIYTHPATANSFRGHAPGYRYADELAALTDPDVKALVRRCGLRPSGYLDAPSCANDLATSASSQLA